MKTTLSRIIALLCFVAPSSGFAQHSTLITTFTNPTPAAFDSFGGPMAAVGTDRVVIGAPNDNSNGGASEAGAAYLFSTNGALLTTFFNPTPATSEHFGNSVAAVGTDRVLIGASEDSVGASRAGAAYLFSNNGALLTTFTNPTPAAFDYFGISVRAVGIDSVLIGAFFDSTGANKAGAAYLFSTNGTLLTTFTNPMPAELDIFGVSVAAVGTDRVVIGAPNDDTGASDAGAAYLFSTNGALLTTFTNPTPAASEYFGGGVAAMGIDLVLIGTYLFSTNGTLLTTFEDFGNSATAVGTDRVLIGDRTAGAAYLLSTNGTLLTTFFNPTPQPGEDFGGGVAVGTDHVLMGVPLDNTFANFAGAAYLFAIQPTLTIQRTITNTVAIAWPSAWTDFTLQQNSNGITTADWINVSDPIQDDGTNRSVTVPASMTGHRFYRLQK